MLTEPIMAAAFSRSGGRCECEGTCSHHEGRCNWILDPRHWVAQPRHQASSVEGERVADCDVLCPACGRNANATSPAPASPQG
jgi:hypothetical protein